MKGEIQKWDRGRPRKNIISVGRTKTTMNILDKWLELNPNLSIIGFPAEFFKTAVQVMFLS